MIFGPKRAHVMFIFERFINDFGLFVLALIIFLFVRDIQIVIDNLFVVAIALFGPISRFIKYICTRYTIDNERLLVESGWLKKEKLEIPLATISSVDMTQNILFQLTHVYGLQIENAGSISGDADGSVKLILGKDDAELAKKLLLAKKNGVPLDSDAVEPEQQEELGQTMRASAGEVLAMSVFQINWVVVAAQMFAYISILGTFLDQYIFTNEKSSTEMLVDFAAGIAPVMIAGAILGTYIISVLISTAVSFIKYYNFRITNREDAIHIQYGLFTRKSHTLMKEKISGIKFQQSLVMRAMKKGTLQIFVTGYGGLDENNQEETVLLYPIVEQKKIYPFLNWLLPEQIQEPEYEMAPSRGIPYFFLCTRFVIALILCSGSIWLSDADFVVSTVGVMILLMTAGSVIMEYKTSAVSVGNSMVIMNYGGYRKHIVMIKRDKMEYVEDTASQLKRERKNLSTLKVGVLAPAGMSSHRVRNMDISVFNNVKDKLIY